MSQHFHQDAHHHDPSKNRQSIESGCQAGRIPDDSTAGRLLRSIRLFHTQGWDQRMISGHTPGEVRVLMGLKHETKPGSPGLKVSEISSILNVTSPTITQFINGLEGKGLVERVMDEHDRRAVRVQLTDSGEQVIRQAFQDRKEQFLGLVDYLGEEDSNKLAELLDKVCQYHALIHASRGKQGNE